MSAWRVISYTVAEGLAWSIAGILALMALLLCDLSTDSGLFRDNFARRADGGCSGWTPDVLALHLIGDLLTWTAYILIAVAMVRLHPIMRRVPSSRITVPLIVLIFSTCGATHLFHAFAAFRPVYVATGTFKLFAGLVGTVGACFIAHNLVTAFALVTLERERLQSKLAELERLGSPGHGG